MKAAILFCLFLLVSSSLGSKVIVYNKCGKTIQLAETGPGYGPNVIANIANGGSFTKDYTGKSRSFNLREGTNGRPVTLFEATFNAWGDQDNYNLSLVDDFDVAMFVDAPSGYGCNKAQLNCPARGCGDAYLFPADNSKMHTCTRTGGTFKLYLCKR